MHWSQTPVVIAGVMLSISLTACSGTSTSHTSARKPANGVPAVAPPVDCGISDVPAGHIHLYADKSTEGWPGCEEVIDVGTAYAADAPRRGTGSTEHLVVQGWSCGEEMTLPGFRCAKDGLQFDGITSQARG